MRLNKTIIFAAMFGMSASTCAAVSDISNVTHRSKAGQQPTVGQMT